MRTGVCRTHKAVLTVSCCAYKLLSARFGSARVGHIDEVPNRVLDASVSSDRRALRFEASYESSAAEAFGNLPSSPAYLSPAFLKAEPSSMNFRC